MLNKKKRAAKNNLMIGAGGQMINPMFQNSDNATGVAGPLSGYGMNNALGPLGMTPSNRMGNFISPPINNSNKMKHIIAPPKMDYSDQGFFFDQSDRSMPVIMVSI